MTEVAAGKLRSTGRYEVQGMQSCATGAHSRMVVLLKMSCSRDEVRGLFSQARMLVQSVTS